VEKKKKKRKIRAGAKNVALGGRRNGREKKRMTREKNAQQGKNFSAREGRKSFDKA